MSHPYLRARAAIYRVRGLIIGTALWFLMGFSAFRWIRGLAVSDALLSTFYFQVQSDALSQGYAFWGQSLIFGVFVALIMREALDNYAERCRLMAEFVKNHTIIIGYTHLGGRLVKHCQEKKIPYVLIERERSLVEDLLRAGEPVICQDARLHSTLESANIKSAKRMVIVSHNIDTTLLVIKRAHDANPHLKISVRCDREDFEEVLEKLGADHIYSTSKAAFAELSKVLTH